MGKFKGTSGEWYKIKADQMGVPFIVASGNETLFQVYGEDAESNAKLIAAAPEMLEALQHTLEVLYQCDPPKELFETYANVFANYNDLIHRATE